MDIREVIQTVEDTNIFSLFSPVCGFGLAVRGLFGGRGLSLGLFRPGRAVWALLPGIRRGRSGVPLVLRLADAKTGAPLAAVVKAPSHVSGLHGGGHRYRACHQLCARGSHRVLAMADLCQLFCQFSGPHRPVPLHSLRSGRGAVFVHRAAAVGTVGGLSLRNGPVRGILDCPDGIPGGLRRHSSDKTIKNAAGKAGGIFSVGALAAIKPPVKLGVEKIL